MFLVKEMLRAFIVSFCFCLKNIDETFLRFLLAVEMTRQNFYNSL